MSKLFVKTEFLDTRKHSSLRWHCKGAECEESCCFKPVRSPIGFSEIETLSLYFPVAFPLIQGPEGRSRFEVNILFKLEGFSGPCLYLDPQRGCTLGIYKPRACKQYPFYVQIDNLGRKLVVMDKTCPGFSEEEGEPLFPEKDTLNPYFQEEFISHATAFADDLREAQRFVDELVKHELIQGGTFSYKGVDVPLNIVNEEKLWSLPKDVLDSFRRKGYIRAIYNHLHSLQNMIKLINFYLDWKEG